MNSPIEPLLLATLLIDPKSRTLAAFDDAALSYTKRSRAELLDCAIDDFFCTPSKEDWDAFLVPNESSAHLIQATLSAADGQSVEVVLHRSQLKVEGRNYILIAVMSSGPIMATAAYLDALTGLPDRRELRRRYTDHQLQSKNDPRSVALLFLDLENFKAINDRYGHQVGDQVLVALSQRWSDSLRDQDLLARYGGDEFIILLFDLPSENEARLVENRLQQLTAKPIQVGELELQVAATIGVAFDACGESALEDLIAEADRRMYATKRQP